MIKTENRFDTVLLVLTLILVLIGLLMVSSATTTGLKGNLEDVNPSRFFIKECFYILLGIIVLLLTIHLDYRFWFRLLPIMFFILGSALLFLLFKGNAEASFLSASRWIQLGPITFQPSVPMVFLSVLLWAQTAARAVEQEQHRTFYPYLSPLIVIGVFSFLIYRQPDLGTAAIMIAVSILMMFLAGTPLLPVAGISILLAAVGSTAMIITPWRRQRLHAFIDPWSHPNGSGYQIIHSLFALARGGWTGVGLGQGKEKALYLPECHTDFIFAVIGEEFGFVGTVLVVFLFSMFLWRGYRIAVRQRSHLGYFTAMGLTSLIGIQAAVNIAVVTKILPTKGLTLPFISWGGTSMLMCLWAVGILLHLSQAREGKR